MPIRIVFPLLTMALATLLSLSASASESQPGDRDRMAITHQLGRYEQALNRADIDTIMALYAKDAVFMPQHGQPAVGRDAVLAAYRHVFEAIRLDIAFSIDEIVVLSPDWAYARTRSNGTVKVLAAGQPPAPEANQELFLLHREKDGQWRFARYIFSTTNPPRKP
jgi:uncharacterized protein (TIGR02246 family)